LTLYAQGFKNVIPIYGVNGLLDEHLALFNSRIKETYIIFDADEAGIKGAEALALRLKEKEIVPYIVSLPVKDVNIFFKRQTPEELEALLRGPILKHWSNRTRSANGSKAFIRKRSTALWSAMVTDIMRSREYKDQIHSLRPRSRLPKTAASTAECLLNSPRLICTPHDQDNGCQSLR